MLLVGRTEVPLEQRREVGEDDDVSDPGLGLEPGSARWSGWSPRCRLRSNEMLAFGAGYGNGLRSRVSTFSACPSSSVTS